MRRRVEAYLDGHLDEAADARDVQAHLDECWTCSGEAETLRLIKRSLARLSRRQPSELAAVRVRRWAQLRLR